MSRWIQPKWWPKRKVRKPSVLEPKPLPAPAKKTGKKTQSRWSER